MDKHTKESTVQSIQEDDTEESPPLFEPESMADNADSEEQLLQIAMEDIQLDESELKKENQVEDGGEGSISTDVCEGEVEFKDLEVVDLLEEREKPYCPSEVESKTKTSMDNTNSKSKIINPQLESGPSSEVINIPTHQASDTSVSTSNTISNSLAKCSEPIAIPSTSRDSSGLAPEKSSPKRPTNFGPNVKQAIHVFHPRHPKSILQRLPIPLHSGRWVYLRDSPESSDYGGSPDSLEDPFLMEALEISTPENEMEDLDTPVNEETSLRSPSLLNPIEDDSSSESGQVERAIEHLPLESSHIEGNIGDLPSESGNIGRTIEGEEFELGHIEGIIGDLPSKSGYIEGSIGDESSESGHIEGTIRDLPSESCYNERTFEDLLSELRYIERTIGDEPFESCHIESTSEDPSETNHIEGISGDYLSSKTDNIKGTIGDLPSESGCIEGNIGDESSESGHIQGMIGELPSESGSIERSIIKVPSEWDQCESVDIIIETGPVESSIEELPTESGHIEHQHHELVERDEVGTENLPSESDHIERGIVDLPSDSGQCGRSTEHLPSQ